MNSDDWDTIENGILGGMSERVRLEQEGNSSSKDSRGTIRQGLSCSQHRFDQCQQRLPFESFGTDVVDMILVHDSELASVVFL